MTSVPQLLVLLAFFLSCNVLAWEQISGSAHDVADGWVIGTGAEGGGYGIYRWNGSNWDKMPSSAVSIGGTGVCP